MDILKKMHPNTSDCDVFFKFVRMSPHSKSDLFLLKRYCISYPVNGGEWHFLSSLDGSNPWKARVRKVAGFNYTLKIGFCYCQFYWI